MNNYEIRGKVKSLIQESCPVIQWKLQSQPSERTSSCWSSAGADVESNAYECGVLGLAHTQNLKVFYVT